jgi:hypothetical protein
VELQVLGGWCARHLAAPVHAILFRGGYLSEVVGVELADGRSVVVKARPVAPRLSGCFLVQEQVFRRGFPCPKPLVSPQPYDPGRVATAEAYVAPASGVGSVDESAALLARLISMLRTEPFRDDWIRPPPAWVHWEHPGHGLWPMPDDDEVDLNSVEVPWIDDFGAKAREVLLGAPGPRVVAHVDWVPQNLCWNTDGSARAVHDWDSLAVLPEPAVVGVAAAIYVPSATAEQTQMFLHAYQVAGSVRWTPRELRVALAAAMWVRLFDSKKDLLAGRPASFNADEAKELAQLGTAER